MKISATGTTTNVPNSDIDLTQKYINGYNIMYLYKLVDIFVLDYDALTTRISVFKEELIQTAYSPKRIQRLLDEGIDIEELEKYL
jgi:hypothetical protein